MILVILIALVTHCDTGVRFPVDVALDATVGSPYDVTGFDRGNVFIGCERGVVAKGEVVRYIFVAHSRAGPWQVQQRLKQG
jgi:hypothetical protein